MSTIATAAVDDEACASRFEARFRALQARPPDSITATASDEQQTQILHTRYSKWGLFSMLNNLAVAMVGAAAGNMTLCVRTDPWPYAPSPAFEAAHGCRGAGCYFAAVADGDLWPTACGSSNDNNHNGLPIEVHDVVGPSFRAAARKQVDEAFGAGCGDAARAAATRWLFRGTPAVQEHADQFAAALFFNGRGGEKSSPPSPPRLPLSNGRRVHRHRLPRYVAMHVRWGDKVREASKVSATAYVAAALELCRTHGVSTVVLTTSSPAAVVAIAEEFAAATAGAGTGDEEMIDDASNQNSRKQQQQQQQQQDGSGGSVVLRVPPSNSRMADSDFSGGNQWLNKSALPEDSFLAAYSDEALLLSAVGCAVTLSSNMGRFPHWHNLAEIQAGRFELRNLDRDQRTGAPQERPHRWFAP